MLDDIYDNNIGEGTDNNKHVHPSSSYVRQNVWRTMASDPYFDTHTAVGGESSQMTWWVDAIFAQGHETCAT